MVNDYERNINIRNFPVLDFKRTMDEIHALNFKPEVLPKLLRDNTRRIYKLA